MKLLMCGILLLKFMELLILGILLPQRYIRGGVFEVLNFKAPGFIFQISGQGIAFFYIHIYIYICI